MTLIRGSLLLGALGLLVVAGTIAYQRMHVIKFSGMERSQYLTHSKREKITDIRSWYPELQFGGLDELVVKDRLCVFDPISICDPYNPNTNVVADYVRRNGVFIVDLEGDGTLSIWLQHPYLIVPTHCPAELIPPGTAVAEGELAIDSASFVFLAPNDQTPQSILIALDNSRDVVNLQVQPGLYRFQMAWRDQQLDPNGNWDGVLIAEWSSPTRP